MDERSYLRELAKQQAELANSPQNRQLERLWYEHNSLKGTRAMIVVEDYYLNKEHNKLQCVTEQGRYLEEVMQRNLYSAEFIKDDKVIPDTLAVPVAIKGDMFGVKMRRTMAADGVAYHDEPIINDIERDLELLSHTDFYYDKQATETLEQFAQDTIGDILPTRRINALNMWHFVLTEHVVRLMGMENMYLAMYDSPDKLHELMRFLTEDMKRLIAFEEQHSLIYANGANDYTGSGNFCFCDELLQNGVTTASKTWGHLNSQEAVGISPDMYDEFVNPYYSELASMFGMLYYGCCEPVEKIYDSYISKLPGLRKVSVSPWCDEQFMGERLSDKSVVYSRKPSPNFFLIDASFDEQAFTQHIKTTADAAKNCELEYIFRDIYTNHNNPQKIQRAVEIVRSFT